MSTRAETIVAKLTQLGYVEQKPLTRYRVFAKTGSMNKYVGSHGALRSGTTITSAHPVGGGDYEEIIRILNLSLGTQT